MSGTTKFATGAVRSSDVSDYSFTSLPMVGLLALARTAGEGAAKYGRYNYLQGLPVHDLLDHAFRHIVMYTAGDRSEPHLAHAAWGLLVATQEEALNPNANEEHMLGPGSTIGEAMKRHMTEQKPILAKNRENPETDFSWSVRSLKDVATLCEQRTEKPEEAKGLFKSFCGISTDASEDPDVIAGGQTNVFPRLAGIECTAKLTRSVVATWKTKTKVVPADIRVDNIKIDLHVHGYEWDMILMAARAEDEYALTAPPYKGKRVLVINWNHWIARPVVAPMEF